MARSSDMATAAAAAGTLQNLSREAASRQLIRQQGAVPLLAALLSASDLQANSLPRASQSCMDTYLTHSHLGIRAAEFSKVL